MTAGPDRDYVHGTDPEEQRRLADLNHLINRASLTAIAPPAGERLVDFGCGLGQFARDFARAAGVAAVGIERSSEQLARAAALDRADGDAALVEFRPGDALAPPLRDEEWGTFDVAHARFLLEHVPDPAAVVRGMVAAVRPGGRVVLSDDDHALLRLHPEPAGFAPV
jgi:SAM-dependent methyltransferase